MLYIMVSMGLWQWHKGEYRDHLEQTVKSRMDLPPVTLNLLPQEPDQRKYLPVQITGRFDSERQFLHDNRIYQRYSGYHVYTPFITDTGVTLLVNRGWQPLGRTRQDFPDLAVTNETITISGLIDSLPAKGVVLSNYNNAHTGWPQVLQYLDIDELQSIYGSQLMNTMLWLTPETEHGYFRQYPALDLNSEKNFGYAFQWFAMCVALGIIFLVVNTKRIKS